MSIAENYQHVLTRVATAAKRARRSPDEIKLVAVSKTQPVSAIKEAIGGGCHVFGENKVQEAEGKIIELGQNSAEWHLIGHLQSNKVRKAVQLFDVIHTVRLGRTCDAARAYLY